MSASTLFELHGRTALVTGAANGLGRAFCLALGKAGAQVFCVDRDAQELEQTAALSAAAGIKTVSIVADLAQESDVQTMVAKINAESGRISVLVNNAGIATLPGRTHEIAVKDWDRVIAANLRSLFLVTRAIVPIMLSARAGSIINLSSILGLVGAYPGFAITAVPYASSKAGIIGFTRQLAIEYAADGIRVNAIAPGWHGPTRLGRERHAIATAEDNQRFETYINGSVPMGHRGSPEDLCGLLVYLASDASRYMTGQVLAHDGGVTAA